MEVLRECKCGTTATTIEELVLFVKHSKSPLGRTNCCKKCHYEKTKEKNKAYYLANKELFAEYSKKYRETNKEALSISKAEYYLNNKEELLVKVREFAAKNPEKVRSYKQKYSFSNPNIRKVSAQKRRARLLEVEENFLRTDAEYIAFLFNYSCFNCGGSEVLCYDHTYPLSLGYALTRTNCTLLCRSCNSSKGSKLPEEFYTEEQFIALIKLTEI